MIVIVIYVILGFRMLLKKWLTNRELTVLKPEGAAQQAFGLRAWINIVYISPYLDLVYWNWPLRNVLLETINKHNLFNFEGRTRHSQKRAF